MRRTLVLAGVVGVVVLAYVCGVGRGTVPDAATAAAGWSAVVALCLGIGVGGAYARARRARQDWVDTRDRVRDLRRSTFGLAWLLVKWGIAALALAAAAVAMASQR